MIPVWKALGSETTVVWAICAGQVNSFGKNWKFTKCYAILSA